MKAPTLEEFNAAEVVVREDLIADTELFPVIAASNTSMALETLLVTLLGGTPIPVPVHEVFRQTQAMMRMAMRTGYAIGCQLERQAWESKAR